MIDDHFTHLGKMIEIAKVVKRKIDLFARQVMKKSDSKANLAKIMEILKEKLTNYNK